MANRARSIGTLAAWVALFVLASGSPGLTVDKRKELREQGRQRESQRLKVSETSVEGSAYRAYRVEAILNVDVETAARVATQIVITPSRAPENQVRKLIWSDGDVFLVYTMIDVPFAADRDVIVRVEETRDEGSGSRSLVWRATEAESVPPVAGVVRITRSEGFWRFTPLSSGQTRVVYQNHTDAGGSIPGWLVRSMLRDEAADQIGVLRARIREFLHATRDVAGAPPTGRDLAPQ